MDMIWTIALFALLAASALVLTPVLHEETSRKSAMASAFEDKWIE